MSKRKEKSETLESIERLLRRTRKEQGLSLDDVVRSTRVRRIHLKQFETKLPDPLDVYQLGYLRLYARHLGVDIQKYFDASAQNNSNQSKAADMQLCKLGCGLKLPYVKNILGALLIALVIASAVMFVKKNRSVENSAAMTNPAPTETQPETETLVADKPAVLNKIDPHTYVLLGTAEQISKAKVTAQKTTSFTIEASDENKFIRKGLIKAGGIFRFPTDIADGKITIHTNVEDAIVMPETVPSLSSIDSTKNEVSKQ